MREKRDGHFMSSTLLFLISEALRDPLLGEFEPRVRIKQGSTAGSEMALPFFWKSSLGLFSIRNRQL
jgi:hypothetical protein